MIVISISFIELICYSFHLGHSANYILASPLITPDHIVPEWYFLGLYGILRAIPNKLFGIISMFSLIIHFIQAFIIHEYDYSNYYSPRTYFINLALIV